MKLKVTHEWLDSVLARCDDAVVGAGGTPLEQFMHDVERRVVTPRSLSNTPTTLGRVIRFVREKNGWSRSELAQRADIDEVDLTSLETQADYDPAPRTVVLLADICHFKREQFIQLAQHRSESAANTDSVRFAACSNGTDSVSDEEYEVVRALVETLIKQSTDVS